MKKFIIGSMLGSLMLGSICFADENCKLCKREKLELKLYALQQTMERLAAQYNFTCVQIKDAQTELEQIKLEEIKKAEQEKLNKKDEVKK